VRDGRKLGTSPGLTRQKEFRNLGSYDSWCVVGERVLASTDSQENAEVKGAACDRPISILGGLTTSSSSFADGISLYARSWVDHNKQYRHQTELLLEVGEPSGKPASLWTIRVSLGTGVPRSEARVGRGDSWVARFTLEGRTFLWMPVTISRLQGLTRDILLADADRCCESGIDLERGSTLLGAHHPDTAGFWRMRKGVLVAKGERTVLVR
jgi:hypothetical protein